MILARPLPLHEGIHVHRLEAPDICALAIRGEPASLRQPVDCSSGETESLSSLGFSHPDLRFVVSVHPF